MQMTTRQIENRYENESSLLLKTSPNFTFNIDPDSDNVIHSKYCDIEELQSMKILNKNNHIIIFFI